MQRQAATSPLDSIDTAQNDLSVGREQQTSLGESTGGSGSDSDTAVRHGSGCIRKSTSARIVHIKKAPGWYKPRDHVWTGYRVDHSAIDCVVGLFEWHGETVNIWSHVVAMLVTIVSLVWLATCKESQQAPVYVVLSGCVLLSSVLNMFGWSVVAHVFHCISPWHQNHLWCVDILSIKFVWLARAIMELFFLVHREELIVAPVALLAVVYALVMPVAVNFGEVTKKMPRFELFTLLALLAHGPTLLHYLLAFRPRVVAAGCSVLLEIAWRAGSPLGSSYQGSAGSWQLSSSIRPDTDHGPAGASELAAASHAPGALRSSENIDEFSHGASDVYSWFTEPTMGHERWALVAKVLGPAAVDGVQGVHSRTAVQYALISTAIGFLAMVIYVSKVPERWYPGRFDLVGQSHNIWHVLGALSPLVWMWYVAPACLEWRYGGGAA